ncbi:MAG TPA: PRC-barrel domain-containing protein [Blastocatellia bacterium]|nr:PRC-barrel domain-containing protein [Blastocatellia bacterium]
MLRSVNDLKDFEIVATDGEIGSVEQFYFDDERWAVRYIVVNTGSWLSGRQVLLSPFSVMHVDRENKKLQVTLTKSQVEKSPNIDMHKPVSRQMEAAHSDYYGYSYYWGSPLLWGSGEYPVAATQQMAAATAGGSSAAAATATTGRLATTEIVTEARVAPEDVHLRSTQEVASYNIAAMDGEIGHIKDFILEDDSWTIRYLAIDTRNWLSGKKVLVSPQWVSSVDWAQGKVHVNLSREGIKESPEYEHSKLISREYEQQLYQHYRQPDYWSEQKQTL